MHHSSDHRFRLAVLATVAVSLATACGGGGGGNGLGIPVGVPGGSGQLPIQMAGTWEIRGSTVIDTNDPAAVAPLNGTPLVIGVQGVISLGGLSVSRADIEALLGFPLDLYVNQLDGRTLLYGLSFDRRAQGGERSQVGVAGGSVDDNTIAVEQYSSVQRVGQDEVYIRSRYTLARVSASVQLPATIAAPASEGAGAGEGTDVNQTEPTPRVAPAGPERLAERLAPLLGR